MSDPVSASIEIALSAIKTGAAIATWWDTKQANRSRDGPSDSFGTGYYRQGCDDLLYVMATLGQWMFSLDVIEASLLPTACPAVRRAFEAGDPEDDDLGTMFDSMDQAVQYAVTAGMVFCSECWPMHMWKGFGCGVLNEMSWADPNHSNIHCLELDNSIAALKSLPHNWQLLKKSPSAISNTEPETLPREKALVKKLESYTKDYFHCLEKKGFPQPTAPFQHIAITNWWIPFATWNGNSMYENQYHLTNAISKYQNDPGRFLWAWTAGKRSKINVGEALFLTETHIQELARWLEGLNGIEFRVLLDTQVEFSKIKFSRSIKKMNVELSGNEHGVKGEACCLVHDPKLVVRRSTINQQPTEITNIQTTFSKIEPTSPISPPSYTDIIKSTVDQGLKFPQRRPLPRPLPKPPSVALRKVTATHDFAPASKEELAFVSGDIIEIVDDTSNDGWWKGQLRGKTGLILSTFVKEIKNEDATLAKEPIQTPEKDVIAETVGPPVKKPESAADQVENQSVPISNDRKSLQVAPSGQVGEVSQTQVNVPAISPVIPVQQTVHLHEVRRSSSVPIDTTMNSIQQNLANASISPPQSIQQNQIVSTENVQQSITETATSDEPSAWGVNDSSNQAMGQPTVMHTFYGHSKPVRGVVFAPNSNLVASGGQDDTVRLWDSTTGKVEQVFSGHNHWVQDVCFTPDGRVLASASLDKSIKLWDTRTRTSLQTLKLSGEANAVSVSPDGRMLAAGLSNDKIEIWDGRSINLLHKMKGHSGQVQGVAFSPDGSKLASGSNDHSVRTWDARSGMAQHKIKAHPGIFNNVTSVAFSPDGKLLASTSWDCTVKLWDPVSALELRTHQCPGYGYSVAFSPDNTMIAVGTSRGKVVIWNLEGTELTTIEAHDKQVNSIDFSSDSCRLITASEDTKVKMWKLR